MQRRPSKGIGSSVLSRNLPVVAGNVSSQEQSIQAGIVKSFADVLARCQEDAGFTRRNRGQRAKRAPQLLLSHAASEDEEMGHAWREVLFQRLQVFRPLRQHHR